MLELYPHKSNYANEPIIDRVAKIPKSCFELTIENPTCTDKLMTHVFTMLESIDAESKDVHGNLKPSKVVDFCNALIKELGNKKDDLTRKTWRPSCHNDKMNAPSR